MQITAGSLPSTSWIYDSWKNVYPLVNGTFTGRFSLANSSVKAFVHQIAVPKLWRNKRSTRRIGHVVFFSTRVASLSCQNGVAASNTADCDSGELRRNIKHYFTKLTNSSKFIKNTRAWYFQLSFWSLEMCSSKVFCVWYLTFPFLVF